MQTKLYKNNGQWINIETKITDLKTGKNKQMSIYIILKQIN